MSLSTDLISQFVKVTNDKSKDKSEVTVYGTAKIYNNAMYVQIDGSELLTPISTTADVKDGERVTVMIKNHEAVITGNITSPSARAADVVVETEDGTFTIVDVHAVVTETLSAVSGDIKDLQTDNVNVKQRITAAEGNIGSLKTNKLDVTTANATYATIKKLEALQAEVDKLEVGDLDAVYANIDFSNITAAAMEYFYSNSGLIHNVVVGNGNITGELVGVTISGDLIEGNTVVADKLVIRGEDGLYYKLNTDGMTTEAEQTEYNSLDGSIFRAKSITATKIDVSDLVAFDATIGGFNITDHSIYSEVKDSEGNTTRGIYMDVDGQFNFGDGSNYVKYYKDESGNYKLAISAESIMYALNGKQYSISDLGKLGEYIHIGVYEGEPCIELGESDSDFRLIITNTRILFMEGTDLPAYINNKALNIKKAVVEEELHQGGFMWKIRSNGNLGLVWKGE